MIHMSEDGKFKNLTDRLLPVILIAVIGLAFAVGVLWQKVNFLQGGGNTQVAGAKQEVGTPLPAAPEEKLTADQAAKLPKVTDADHIQGDKNADVLLIEYSDLQCPFCGSFQPTAEKIYSEYKGKVALVYRHFPLDTIHPKARPAAVASECVASLGGNKSFWEFIGKIFADQTGALDKLSDIAKQVGVNTADLDKCIAEKKMDSKVEEQYQGGSAAGVNGTPASFLVNKKGEVWLISGALPFEQMKAKVDEALK